MVSGYISIPATFICLSLAVLGFLVDPNSLVAQSLVDPELTERDTSYVRKLNEEAADLLHNGEARSARPIIQQAIVLSELINDIEGEAFAINNLANYYLERGLPDSLITAIEPNFPKYSNTTYETQIGNQLANSHNKLGNYQQGLELYLEMRELAAERDETRMLIGITQNLGNNYKSLGDIPSALDSYLSSLEMAEEINDTLIIALVLDNLASINVDDGKYEIGEEYLLRALEMNREMNHTGNLITSYMSLGGLYKKTGLFEKSTQHYDRVLELADSAGNILARMQALYNIGMLSIEMGQYDRALGLFEESLALSRENNIGIGLFYNQNGMGNAYAALGEYERAIENYRTALIIADNAKAMDLISGVLHNLYETFENAGDTVQAFHYLKRYSALTDSLSGREREEALARQETLLGLRSERESRALLEQNLEIQQTNMIVVSLLLGVIFIALILVFVLLQKKKIANELLRKRSEELTTVNAIKDRLLSVLAHDLRTPISSLQGLVYTIRENILEKEDTETALTQIDAQLQQEINTLTNYLQWAQSQGKGISANVENISISSVAKDILFEINRVAHSKGVVVENRIPEGTMAFADKHMTVVILRNLLSNAVKFVGRGDKIRISVMETKHSIDISVHDTGNGIPYKKQENLFTAFTHATPGSAGEIGTGLGLSICKQFAEEQGGSILFESEPDKGTTFILSLQKAAVVKNKPVPAALL